jgi:regulator of sigma E protease
LIGIKEFQVLLTVVAFIVALGVLIAVHEWGHYRVAVACGVKVLRYSVGFGKPLLRWVGKKSGTEYVIAALPLGGYVRMLDEREGEVRPEEKHLAFNNQPLRSRAAIVAAGPVANLVLAVALLAVVNWVGTNEPAARLVAPPEGTLLHQAGIQSGDWVQRASVGGKEWQPVRALGDLRWLVTTAAIEGETLQLEVAAQEHGAARVVPLDLASLQQKEPMQLLTRSGCRVPGVVRS